MDAPEILKGPAGDTLDITKVQSRQKQIMEHARKLGRMVGCCYCGTKTVAPLQDRYIFTCTRCEAEWNPDGTAACGPKKLVDAPMSESIGEADGGARFMDLTGGD